MVKSHGGERCGKVGTFGVYASERLSRDEAGKIVQGRKAETPKRPSLSLRLRAPYLYPDRGDSALFLGNMGSIQRETRPSMQREDQLTMERNLNE